MDISTTTGNVAVYIDFDNIVMSRYDHLHGRESFRNDKAGARHLPPLVKNRLEDAHVDIGAIMDYATTFGTVIVARAYANWAAPVNARYADDLQERAIDLVQLFPLTRTKNGADIRLAVDSVEDQYSYAHLSHIVVVAGDSDYVALAQRSKRTGRRVLGVGVGNSVGKYWRSACDEFRNYEDLEGVADGHDEDIPPQSPVSPIRSDSTDLLRKAITLLRTKSDSDWLSIGGVKSQMQRLDSSFNERSEGHKTFTNFLESRSTVVETQHRDGTLRVRLRDTAGALPTLPPGAAPVAQPRSLVATIRQRLGLPVHGSLTSIVEAAVVSGVRNTWLLLEQNSVNRVATADLIAKIVGSGFEESDSRRAAHVINSTGLPIAVRNTELLLAPNSELSDLDDASLLSFAHAWWFDRVRNLAHPEAVSVADMCEAVYGAGEVSAVAKAAYERTQRLATFSEMAAALKPQLVPAPVLWDIAEAVMQIPVDTVIRNVEEFADSIEAPMRDLERDLAEVRVATAYLALRNAGVLVDDLVAGFRLPTLELSDDVVDAVMRSWAQTLINQSLLVPGEPVSRESFYRICLPDRFQAGERNWIRELLPA